MSRSIFIPARGSLTARMFENLNNGIANCLVYDITIPVHCVLGPPAELDTSYATPTDVRLELIRIGLVDWRDLPSRLFTFPVNPVAGYVDGSVYFDGVHHYADLTRLRFGELTGATLTAAVTITFNFYKNSALPDLPESVTVDWNIELDIEVSALDRVIAEARAVL